jgi:hypothetical protein
MPIPRIRLTVTTPCSDARKLETLRTEVAQMYKALVSFCLPITREDAA